MDKTEFVAHLKKQVEIIGSQKEAAEAWGISTQFLNDLLRGRRDPSPAILNALGMKKEVDYK